jgi:hypothetical protein
MISIGSPSFGVLPLPSKSRSWYETCDGHYMKASLALVTLLLSMPVLGQDDFNALDRDGDGMLTQREALPDPRISLNFEALDRNRDRLLSAREYRLLLL